MLIMANAVQVTGFLMEHGFFSKGTVDELCRVNDFAEVGVDAEGLAHMIWLHTDPDLFQSTFRAEQVAQIKQLVIEELSGCELTDADLARKSAHDHPELVSRVIEVSYWSPAITQKVTCDNCVLLESSGEPGEEDWVAFRVHGNGYAIDFANHTASRNTAYDA